MNSHVLTFGFVSFDSLHPINNLLDKQGRVEPVLSKDKCVLLKDHNAVTPVRLEPRPLGFESSNLPLRSLLTFALSLFYILIYMF